MSLDDFIASLVAGLMAATSFEDAATTVLKAMFRRVSVRARDSAATTGRLLRAVVHVRPDDGYQRLFGIEHGSETRVEGTGYLTSANVWRWIVEHGCSVSIDVRRATIRSWLRDGPVEQRDADLATAMPGDATRERMLSRDATHVCVVPLRAAGGDVLGMITLEAGGRAATGWDALWESCQQEFEILASIAAGYLAALPLRKVATQATDELLPVIGPTMAGLIELLRIFARQEETILISGPNGSGKSRLAEWCHAQSSRRKQPFETFDLLGVSEELQMAELRGWKKGAFTGAEKDKRGAISRAAQGTLFIDEIDKLSLKAQAGLLRVLETRRFRPLGDDSNESRADARFIIGTNADLRAAVRAGRFREDLYFRINVLPVRLPALAERLDELPLWAVYMLERRHREGGEGAALLAPGAVKRLLHTPWPGNLRQLDNIVRRAYAFTLAEHHGKSGLVLGEPHVERALAQEGSDGHDLLITLLWRTALAFVREAERREGTNAPLVLEHCDVLRGMVMAAAVGLQRDRDRAFVLLGEGHLLPNRNHHRTLRAGLKRVRDVARALGAELDAEIAAALDEADQSPRGK